MISPVMAPMCDPGGREVVPLYVYFVPFPVSSCSIVCGVSVCLCMLQFVQWGGCGGGYISYMTCGRVVVTPSYILTHVFAVY